MSIKAVNETLAGPSLDGDPALRAAWWRAGASTVVVLLFLLGLYAEEAASAVRIWNSSPTYTHCYLILPISLYLIWDRRAVFSRYWPRPMLWPLLLLPPAGLVGMVAEVASIQEAQHFVLLGMIQIVLFSMLGWRVYMALLFPFLYLFFLVPSGEFMVPALQDFTAEFAVLALQLIGIPVYKDGIFISIPNGHFVVAEACAGLRFLVAALAFGFLFANMTYRSYGRRVTFVVLSIVVPIFANGLRAFGLIMIAHLSNHQLAVGVDHLVYGWLFFSLVIVLLIVIGMQFREDKADDDDAAAPPPPPTGGRIGRFGAVTTAVLIVAAISIAPAYAGYVRSLEPDVDLTALTSPAVAGDWRRVEATGDWRPRFPGADAILHQAYRHDGRQVDLFVAFYGRQRSDAEVVSHDNRFYDDDTWRRSGHRRAQIELAGERRPVILTEVLSHRRKRLVVSRYWVDDTFTASGLKAKLLQARAELLTGRRPAAVVAASAEYELDPADALAVIDSFLRQVGPLDPLLRAAARFD